MPLRKLTKADVFALHVCIAKYRRYAAYTKAEDIDSAGLLSRDCALCDLHLGPMYRIKDGLMMYCGNCPVRERTGHALCRGTPYAPSREAGREEAPMALDDLQYVAADSHSTDKERATATRAFKLRCAQEADFLQSILDERVWCVAARKAVDALHDNSKLRLGDLLYANDVARRGQHFCLVGFEPPDTAHVRLYSTAFRPHGMLVLHAPLDSIHTDGRPHESGYTLERSAGKR